MTARRSKLDWYKSLRGADLTPAEAYVLVLLAGYSNASRENAYPGVLRLAADSGIDKRRVQRILKSLVAKKAIAVTAEGGNQVRKGAATVYMVLTPPQRTKGGTGATLQGDKGAPPFTLGDCDKGGISSTKGGTTGPGRVVPTPPHQVIHQVIDHHSESNASGAPAPQSRAHLTDEDDELDLMAIEDQLDTELGLDDEERRTVDGMLQRGSHPNAVRNKITKDRLGQFSGAFNGVNEDQRQERLKEEAKCRTCGVTTSGHDRWMAEVVKIGGDVHPFVRRTKRRTA